MSPMIPCRVTRLAERGPRRRRYSRQIVCRYLGSRAPGQAGRSCRRLGAVALVFLAVSGGACGSNQAPEATETTGLHAPVDFRGSGPFAVGWRTIEINSGNEGVRADIFYPVDSSDASEEDLVGELSLAAVIPDGTPSTARERSPSLPGDLPELHSGVAVSEEAPFPVVIHSHGWAGHPLLAAGHLSHIASWGYFVAGVEHQSRSLASVVAGSSRSSEGDLAEMEVLLDELEQLLADPEDPFHLAVDLDLLAAEGHSSGAASAMELAKADPRVATVIAHSPVLSSLDLDESEDDETLSGLQPPGKSVLLSVGELDGVVPPEAVDELFQWLEPSRQLVQLSGAGHNALLDYCGAIRDGDGLGEFGDISRELADVEIILEDGCTTQNSDPDRTRALLGHLTLSHLRWVLEQPTGEPPLQGPGVLEDFDGEVTSVQVDP